MEGLDSESLDLKSESDADLDPASDSQVGSDSSGFRPCESEANAAALSDTELQQAFAAMDTDSNGSLDRTEIRQLLINTVDQELPDEDLNAAIAAMDQDKDSLISYSEFEKCWRRLERRSSTSSLSPLEQALASGILSSVGEYQARLRDRR